MSEKENGFAAALLILGLVGLIYAIAQSLGDLPAISGVADVTLAFFGIVGIVIGGYYLSE